MKLSKTCMSDVLSYLEENLSVTVDTKKHPDKYVYNGIGFKSIFKALNDKYPNECELYYVIQKLEQMGLIKCERNSVNENISSVEDITPAGHQYLWNLDKN